jgi:hypothetical protein
MALAVCGTTVALVLASGEHEVRLPDDAPARAASHAGTTLELARGIELRRHEPSASRAPVDASADTRAAGKRAQAEPADPTADAIGMTDAHRMTALMRAHEMIAMAAEFPDAAETVALAEVNFLRRCIGTILHHQGRARFPDDEIRRTGFRMGRSEYGEFSFVQDGALYQYDRGEFPTHDVAYDIRHGKPVERPPDMDDRIHAMLLEALDTLQASERK